MKKEYVPARGDVVWFDFEPTRGHEQRGYRPAVIVSGTDYNAKTGLVLACPITSHAKGYPFEIPCTVSGVQGAILVDLIRSMDWRARRMKRVSAISPAVAEEIAQRLLVLVKG